MNYRQPRPSGPAMDRDGITMRNPFSSGRFHLEFERQLAEGRMREKAAKRQQPKAQQAY